MSARHTTQHLGSTDQLMRWRAPRLSQTAHATLAVIVALLAAIVGVAIFAASVESTGTVILFAVLWAFIVTSAVYAYAEIVIRR